MIVRKQASAIRLDLRKLLEKLPKLPRRTPPGSTTDGPTDPKSPEWRLKHEFNRAARVNEIRAKIQRDRLARDKTRTEEAARSTSAAKQHDPNGLKDTPMGKAGSIKPDFNKSAQGALPPKKLSKQERRQVLADKLAEVNGKRKKPQLNLNPPGGTNVRQTTAQLDAEEAEIKRQMAELDEEDDD